MSLDNLTPKKGEIAFVWFNNYAGVTMKTPTKTLVIDPADIDPKVFKTVHAVLVTHEHYDHFDESIIRELHRRSQCSVVADSASAKRLKDVIAANKLHEMRTGKEIKLDNVTIKAEAFKHPATAPVSYLITSEDGIRVYHTGDSLPHSDMRQIGEHNPPDIVFCTVGPPAPGASPQSGLEIVRMVKPKLAVPYHAPVAERKKFAELIARETPNIKCVIAEQNKPVTYP
jgi:L-ascorbate metabolism protein UlaG (beta-lactamase superfamily)